MGHVPKILKSENWDLIENCLNTGHTSLAISTMRHLARDFAFISAIFFSLDSPKGGMASHQIQPN